MSSEPTFDPTSLEDAREERAAERTPRHTCHWPGCGLAVSARFWGCSTHWYLLPAQIRREIWRTYRVGQEIDKQPSPEYLAAAHSAREFARDYDARKEAQR